MEIFSEKKGNNIIVVGCGQLGSSLADTLYDNGNNVTIVDNNEESFRKLSPSFGGLIIEGNGKEIDVLKKLEIESSDIAIVVTDNDNTNIMISHMLKSIFSVNKVLCRLYDSSKRVINENMDIQTICPMILAKDEIINSMYN